MNSEHIPKLEEIIRQDKGVLSISNTNLNLEVEATQRDNFAFLKNMDDSWQYKEKINRKSFIYLIGGGHVGLAVAKLFDMLDFEVTMFDDRRNLNTFDENSYSSNKKIIDYKNIANFIRKGDNSYIVILTHGYEADRLIFSKLLPYDFKYIGLLGSKAKIKAMFKTLIAEGFDKEKLLQADAPIGIPINSKTPAEIAVSIAAKIIAVRNS